MDNNQPRRQTTPWRTAPVLLAASAMLLAGVAPAAANGVGGPCLTVYPSGPGATVDPECNPVGTIATTQYQAQPTLALDPSSPVEGVNETWTALGGVVIHETEPILNETVWNGTVWNQTLWNSSDPDPATGPDAEAVANPASPNLGALAGETGTSPSSTVGPLLSAALPADPPDPLEVG